MKTDPKAILAGFPWNTLGRPEKSDDFFKKCDEQRDRVRLFSRSPLVSIVIASEPGVSLHSLQEAVASVLLQSYQRFELILVLNRDEALPPVAASADTRLRVQYVGGFSTLRDKRNHGAESASGEWIGFLSARDVLSPAALYQFVLEMQTGSPDLLYANEVLGEVDSRAFTQLLSKPEYHWFDLLHLNYHGHFFLVRRPLFDEIGGFKTITGATEHAFLMELAQATDKWTLVPMHLLYHRSEGDLALPPDSVKEIEKHLEGCRFPATVRYEKGGVRVSPLMEEPEKRLVSVIVCFRNRADWTLRSVREVVAHAGEVPIEIILMNNASDSEERQKVLEGSRELKVRVSFVDYNAPFNYGNMHNVAAKEHCRGDFLFLLNNDVFLTSEGALDEMAGWADLPWVGTVGMLLRYGHGDIQHAGLNAQLGQGSHFARVGNFHGANSLAGQSREVFGNTFAACMIRKDKFLSLGGLNELEIPNGFGDVAFNFECLRKGWKNIYLGHLEAWHLESATRGWSYEFWEECVIERRYPEILQRMVRSDLAFTPVRAGRSKVSPQLLNALRAELRERAPWLRTVKYETKKFFRELQGRGSWNRPEY